MKSGLSMGTGSMRTEVEVTEFLLYVTIHIMFIACAYIGLSSYNKMLIIILLKYYRNHLKPVVPSSILPKISVTILTFLIIKKRYILEMTM